MVQVAAVPSGVATWACAGGVSAVVRRTAAPAVRMPAGMMLGPGHVPSPSLPTNHDRSEGRKGYADERKVSVGLLRRGGCTTGVSPDHVSSESHMVRPLGSVPTAAGSQAW